jgi:hypothetical protein
MSEVKRDSQGYLYLGDLSATPPWFSVSMSCDACKVSWTGCWDNFQCPKCGEGELPFWLPHSDADEPFKELAPWNDPRVRWVCEQHPDKDFPHDDCAGPGMPIPPSSIQGGG